MRGIGPQVLRVVFGIMMIALGKPSFGWAADPEVLKPRVPDDQIEEAKTWKNPLPSFPWQVIQNPLP
jgi:hypothetical protein